MLSDPLEGRLVFPDPLGLNDRDAPVEGESFDRARRELPAPPGGLIGLSNDELDGVARAEKRCRAKGVAASGLPKKTTRIMSCPSRPSFGISF